MKAPNRPPLDVHQRSIHRASEIYQYYGWGKAAQRQAKNRGLRVVRFACKDFIRGGDLLKFFDRLAEEQAESKEGGLQ